MANKLKTYMTTLADTSETTLITATETSILIVGSIIISNKHGSTTTTIDMLVTDTSAASDFKILTNEEFAFGKSREVLVRPMIIENLDVLKAQAATGAVFDIIISYLDRDRT